jgi:hypothetical protein
MVSSHWQCHVLTIKPIKICEMSQLILVEPFQQSFQKHSSKILKQCKGDANTRGLYYKTFIIKQLATFKLSLLLKNYLQ